MRVTKKEISRNIKSVIDLGGKVKGYTCNILDLEFTHNKRDERVLVKLRNGCDRILFFRQSSKQDFITAIYRVINNTDHNKLASRTVQELLTKGVLT